MLIFSLLLHCKSEDCFPYKIFLRLYKTVSPNPERNKRQVLTKVNVCMIATTRSKSSSSEKVNQDGDHVSLTLVKELMKTQELTMKSFFASFVENTN